MVRHSETVADNLCPKRATILLLYATFGHQTESFLQGIHNAEDCQLKDQLEAEMIGTLGSRGPAGLQAQGFRERGLVVKLRTWSLV